MARAYIPPLLFYTYMYTESHSENAVICPDLDTSKFPPILLLKLVNKFIFGTSVSGGQRNGRGYLNGGGDAAGRESFDGRECGCYRGFVSSNTQVERYDGE